MVLITRFLALVLSLSMLLSGCGVSEKPEEHIHTFNSEHICTGCMAECLHNFENGVCTVCGAAEEIPEPTPEPVNPETCEHSFIDGTCTVCGYVCQHEKDGTECYSNGYCVICGEECPHTKYVEGFCAICGKEHVHETHLPSGSPFKAPVCSVCGVEVVHNWVNGVCTVCGENFEFVEEELPKDIVISDNNPTGYYHIETLRYPSHFYNPDGTPIMDIDKRMTVYLPPDYDETKTYDLMLMFIGSDTDSEMYFAKRSAYFHIDVIYGAGEMLDNIIQRNLCKPFIAACIDFRSSNATNLTRSKEDSMQVAYELKNDILPYISENYPVYFKNASDEELAANREHIAVFGCSWGTLMVNRSVFRYNFDTAGWYCTVSGSFEEGADMAEAIADRDEPVYYYYACDGAMWIDHCAPMAKKTYYELEALTDKITDGVNGHGSTIEHGRHDCTTWLTALFNYARICFHTENG